MRLPSRHNALAVLDEAEIPGERNDYAWMFLASTLQAARSTASRSPVCIAPLKMMFCVPVIWKSGPISPHLSRRYNGQDLGSPVLISHLARRDGSLRRSTVTRLGGLRAPCTVSDAQR